MSNNKYDSEAELKAAKRAEIERLWFAQEATNEDLLQAYKALDVKKEDLLKKTVSIEFTFDELQNFKEFVKWGIYETDVEIEPLLQSFIDKTFEPN